MNHMWYCGLGVGRERQCFEAPSAVNDDCGCVEMVGGSEPLPPTNIKRRRSHRSERASKAMFSASRNCTIKMQIVHSFSIVGLSDSRATVILGYVNNCGRAGFWKQFVCYNTLPQSIKFHSNHVHVLFLLIVNRHHRLCFHPNTTHKQWSITELPVPGATHTAPAPTASEPSAPPEAGTWPKKSSKPPRDPAAQTANAPFLGSSTSKQRHTRILRSGRGLCRVRMVEVHVVDV